MLLCCWFRRPLGFEMATCEGTTCGKGPLHCKGKSSILQVRARCRRINLTGPFCHGKRGSLKGALLGALLLPRGLRSCGCDDCAVWLYVHLYLVGREPLQRNVDGEPGRRFVNFGHPVQDFGFCPQPVRRVFPVVAAILFVELIGSGGDTRLRAFVELAFR